MNSPARFRITFETLAASHLHWKAGSSKSFAAIANRGFQWIISAEGQGVRLCWAVSKFEGQKGHICRKKSSVCPWWESKELAVPKGHRTSSQNQEPKIDGGFFVGGVKTTHRVHRSFRPAPPSAFPESCTWRGGGKSQKILKCEVSSWGIAPVPWYSHGIITCSRMGRTAHSGILKGGSFKELTGVGPA
jgi:hypothetical protein